MENKTIEALEKLIAIKDETIKELEKQLQLIKNQSTFIPNITIGTQPYIGNPNITINPATIWGPWASTLSTISNPVYADGTPVTGSISGTLTVDNGGFSNTNLHNINSNITYTQNG